ncbi:hypothetical protein HY045_02215 [Candidatus Woesebacteria bacterium]|nr:hypothetical protein [Candidatus Woesebacteria bacterium]
MAASLTQVAIITRKTIRYGSYVIILLIFAKIAFDSGYRIYRYYFPLPPPVPTVSFSKLPLLPFPKKDKVGFSYTLETPEGGLPKLADQARVYFMPQYSSNLLALDTAKQNAESLGFDAGSAQEISQTVYRFTSKQAPSILEMNIITGSFSISFDFSKDPSPLQNKPPLPDIAANQVKSYLSSANLLPKDLDGPYSQEYLKFQDGKLVQGLSVSDSNLIKIKLFRKSYDNNIPSLTPNPNDANIWFMVSGETQRGKSIPTGEYHYFPVDNNKSSTYPLKKLEDAWNELNGGNAYVASMGDNKDGNGVKIRRVYLAYYDPGVPTEFFQPIYVFEGDKGFIGYVPAVDTKYYGS